MNKLRITNNLARNQVGLTLARGKLWLTFNKKQAGLTFARKQAGLTLVEILVVFTVIAILVGFGIASFVTYSRSSELNETANNIKLLINEAKFNSISTVKTVTSDSGQTITCSSGESLAGYRVEIIQPDTIRLSQVCEGSTTAVKSVTLPSTISFSVPPGTACTTIQFSVLSSQATGLPCNIDISGYGEAKSITVDALGNINVN